MNPQPITESAASQAIPLVVILGPTAVGKTGLALQLATALKGEIVSADSRQIYRYMDIGTAKPTPDQREQVKHHLIDVVDPDDGLSVVDFQKRAHTAIVGIHQRECLPLLVGGTGQYITALLEGWTVPEVPPNPTLRANLESFAAEHGARALYNRLIEIDPPAAHIVDPNNVRRIVRALEVYYGTQKPFSAQRQKNPPNYRILTYGLTLERTRLHERADQRLDEMMQAGFLEEVRALLDMGCDPKLPAMSGLGYRQLAKHLLGDQSLDGALQDTRTATHTFIRRQYTWFRKHRHGAVWHDSEKVQPAALIHQTARWLQEPA
ncbi:MAG: tRNA (adenosine(37)-N6)-dimethylallyltransferase MiaA [Chloroflexi bacterium]|nr:tRNA (adenosine(37)-N6)-dimethylallyltransferase MiaA [Chloroflexota bacterium]